MTERGRDPIRRVELPDGRERIISERAAGVLMRPDRQLTVGALLDEWLESKRARRRRRTQGPHALRPVIHRYGHLQALDVPHLEALKRGMLSGELRRVGRAVRRCRPGR
jgi:hypothetical protein